MLHNAGDQHLLPVADGVHLAFLAFHVVVHQYVPFGGYLGGHRQVPHQFRRVLDDFHGSPAQHVAGPHHYRVADVLGHLQGFRYRRHRCPRRLGNAQAGEEFFKPLPVRRYVNGIGAGAQDGQTGVCQGLGQVDGRLSPKLHHRRRGDVVHRFVVDDVPHRLLIQRLKVKTVAGVKVGGHRFRVGVDHHAGDACRRQCPCGVDAAVVELDPLPNADGAAADDDGLPAGQGRSLVFLLVGAVVVGSNRLKLGGAGVHHLVHRTQVPALAQVPHLFGQHVGQGAHLDIGEAQPLGPVQQIRSQGLAQQTPFHVDYALHGADKPRVHIGLAE